MVVAERDGGIVGYGRVGIAPASRTGWRVYELILFAIRRRARVGAVFEALIEPLESRVAGDRGRAIRRARTSSRRSAATRRRSASAILLERGYTPVRHWLRDGPAARRRPAPTRRCPDGLEIREVQPEHLRGDLGRAHARRSRDDVGFNEPATRRTTSEFADGSRHESDTTLWRVAWDGDEVAGQVRGFINAEENERFGRCAATPRTSASAAPWRRRGLARALIAASFPLLRARGMTEAALSVDSENPSGALRVYEGCGFRVVSRSATSASRSTEADRPARIETSGLSFTST